MNNLKVAKMDDHNLLLALAGIISAFGSKRNLGNYPKAKDGYRC